MDDNITRIEFSAEIKRVDEENDRQNSRDKFGDGKSNPYQFYIPESRKKERDRDKHHQLPSDWNEQRKFLGLPVKDYVAG